MEREPAKRIGAHHTSDVKGHVFFADVDFAQLMRREVLPPDAHPLDEPASWNRNGPLGLAGRAPESPFARAERGWRGRYARGQNSSSERGVSGWDYSFVPPTRSSGSGQLSLSAPSGPEDSDCSTSTYRRGVMPRRPSSQSSQSQDT